MGKRKTNFDPTATTPFKLSRSKIESYCECPYCFYLDRKLGVSPPGGLPFNLNSAVDHLLKKEFDSYREKSLPHPFMTKNGVKAIPFQHEKLEDWRKNMKGVTYLHEPTQFLVYGAIDELWISESGELIVVDFKATSKNGEVTLDADWQIGYKRQMEIYQWLLRMNGFIVSDTGYFLYCNGRKDLDAFEGRLEFNMTLIPYKGSDEWIAPKLQEIRACLVSDKIPQPSPSCELCQYRLSANQMSMFS
jgi:hypothetical protein